MGYRILRISRILRVISWARPIIGRWDITVLISDTEARSVRRVGRDVSRGSHPERAGGRGPGAGEWLVTLAGRAGRRVPEGPREGTPRWPI